MPTLLTDLPNEVIFQIFLHVPSSSAYALQRISRRFKDVANPLLWKHHCQTQYRYWGEQHRIQEKYADKAAKIDWKKIFLNRQAVDKDVNQLLDKMLASQEGRIEKSEKIVGLGYDAKDALLRNLNVNENAPDVLARRYYSKAVLVYLHRRMAIQEWVKIMAGFEVPLERALGAFDMFVLRERDLDFDDISTQLDYIARSISIEIPDLDEYSAKQKATVVASYLRRNNLTGIKAEGDYQNLQNNFIGIALQDKDHPSLSIVSVAIYCCVARRLGLDASPCGFPFHVLAIIKPKKGKDLGDRDIQSASDGLPMYMDPFQSDQEIPVSDLQSQLSGMGVAASDYEELLDASSTADIVRKTAWNIISSVQTIFRDHGMNHKMGFLYPDVESAFYSALWALLLFPDRDPAAAEAQRSRYLPCIVEHLERHFFMDVRLIEEYILPLSWTVPHHMQLEELIRVMRVTDTMDKPVKSRSLEASQHVRYHVGQVFKHKRYNYEAVITGWDSECSYPEEWMRQMRVDDLPRGRHQSFYQVLVEDKSVRYVAEENIELLHCRVSHDLMMLAGRHFKRWDDASKTFVSNIRDEYPDD